MGGKANEINCLKEYEHEIVILSDQDQCDIIRKISHALGNADINAVYIIGDLEMLGKYLSKNRCDLVLAAL